MAEYGEQGFLCWMCSVSKMENFIAGRVDIFAGIVTLAGCAPFQKKKLSPFTQVQYTAYRGSRGWRTFVHRTAFLSMSLIILFKNLSPNCSSTNLSKEIVNFWHFKLSLLVFSWAIFKQTPSMLKMLLWLLTAPALSEPPGQKSQHQTTHLFPGSLKGKGTYSARRTPRAVYRQLTRI